MQETEEYNTAEDDDEELKETLAVIGQVNKTLDDVVLRICNEVADEVMKEDP